MVQVADLVLRSRRPRAASPSAHTPFTNKRFDSQPIGRVIELINPVLRGWVNYFAVGHSSRCFSLIEDWVEKKIRRHLMRARQRKGFGWNGGVANGSTRHSGSFMNTGCGAGRQQRKHFQHDTAV
jgi:Group II intron, maturase-specific domain